MRWEANEDAMVSKLLAFSEVKQFLEERGA